MTTIKKFSGNTEEFDRKKIEDSLRNAGADLFTAKEIAARIQEKEGLTTSDIREALNSELRNDNHGLAVRYSNARRFTACNSAKLKRGVARLSKDSMKAFQIKQGDTLEIKYRDRVQEMRIEQSDGTPSHSTIILNKDDMVALGVMDGNRVIVRKPF